MAAFFFVNDTQVDFASVIAMEHTSMVRMFKYLEDTWLKGFLEASGSMYEGAVLEFFANAKVVAGTVISFLANRKLALTKEFFAETFGLQTDGMVGFLVIPTETMVEMRRRFSGSDVPFRAPNKKKEMKMEYRLLHDIVAKALCAKAGSFDVGKSEKFDLMVAISAGLKVNWAQVLFQTLVAMVNTPTKQSQGFAVQTSKVSGDTASEEQSTAESLPSLTDRAEKEAGEMMRKPKKAAVEKPKKKKEKVESIKADTYFTRQSTVQLRRQLETSLKGIKIKIYVLESTLVRHVADSQQHLVDELAFVKSQLAEMVDCINELRDAKKGEGPSKGPGPSIKKRRLLYDGLSSSS
ncbi:hypothetical protein F511_11861 [Dorcoceras hygrometricum]|uniref:Dystroglycan-like n=1 Tax=Dorcoceras hygrometricum TaxID=472368 RepID=A0A2Z7AB44_9LAMI|nr:hypothetical protein F511_11861 [Dorcoceras hygrometricum]